MTLLADRDRHFTRSLNQSLACSFLDAGELTAQLASSPTLQVLAETLPTTHPHLFSPAPVFISGEDVVAIRRVIAAVEAVTALAGFRQRALAKAPAIARFQPSPKGVFFGFDFHLGEDGPKLIEINTNAGGAYLNWALLQAQRACCEQAEPLMRAPLPPVDLPSAWHAMFQAEAGRRIAHMAIVDEHPSGQYLYPEFLLVQAAEQHFGTRVSIVAPEELTWTGTSLLAAGVPVDLVYNRLTDFAFDEPASAAPKAAYLSGRITVTPHPRAHALYANKANLAVLGDAEVLKEVGVSAADIATLTQAIPRTRPVTPSSAAELWATRKHLFFKPTGGFGGRAAYRGDKITTRVWQEILAHDYVAQAFVRPPERLVRLEDVTPRLKFDLRAYVYAGDVQLLAARLYTGQTTNFRTPGGGFAPVYLAPERSRRDVRVSEHAVA